MAQTSITSNLAWVVHRHLERQSPGIRLLTTFFETIYLASLKTEEGKPLQMRLVLVDPIRPDPDKPPYPRPDRWKISRLSSRLPLTVPTLVKISKGADPWSSSLAVYYNSGGEFFVWGLVDQTVHFNTRLVRESASGYAPPGFFQVVATGIADLTVYSGYNFVARLSQDTLLRKQNDVFWSGPIADCIDQGISPYIDFLVNKIMPEDDDLLAPTLADDWIGTLCRILISIQRYGHGGALLLTRSKADLEIKYKIDYGRLPKALRNLAISRLRMREADNELFTEYLDKREDDIPADLYLEATISQSDIDDYEDEITGSVRFISSLSCVDGLVLCTPDLAIRGFGVEIRTKREPLAVYMSSTPRIGTKSLRRIDPNHYGTRHRSMMRYCFAHPKSLGFVISQDAEIRAMTRVKGRLVMWENLKVLSYFDTEPKKRVPPRQKSKSQTT